MVSNFNNIFNKMLSWLSRFLVTGLVPVFSAIPPNSTMEKENDLCISIFDLQSNSVIKISLEELLIGGIAAEMPVSFPLEALKAQGIAIFTYFLKSNGLNKVIPLNFSKGKNIVHFCYKSKAERQKSWGENFDKYENKIKKAVKDIKGKVLYYHGEIALTNFFSCCYKATVPSDIPFSHELPYLVSVSSPEYDYKPLKGTKTINKISKSEMQDILKTNFPDKKEKIRSTDPSKWLTIYKKTEHGYVILINVLGNKVKGHEFRMMFKLRSANFSISYNSKLSEFEISTVGFGHGVGMSQFGAKVFADIGWKYDKILSHYYPGTEIKEFSTNVKK